MNCIRGMVDVGGATGIGVTGAGWNVWARGAGWNDWVAGMTEVKSTRGALGM